MDKDARDSIVAFQIQNHVMMQGKQPLPDAEIAKFVQKMNGRVAVATFVFGVLGILLQVAASLALAAILQLPALQMIAACERACRRFTGAVPPGA